MSLYNGQLSCDSTGTPIYLPANDYPSHGVQVQIPRITPELLYQSNAVTFDGNQQVYAIENKFQSNSQLPLLPPQANVNAPPRTQAQASTNGYSLPASTIRLAQVSEPSFDNQMVLLALAEEYLTTAFGQSSGAEVHEREKDIGLYYKLIATGLGCLDAVLRVLSSSIPWRAMLNRASKEDCPQFWKPELDYDMLRYYFRRRRITWRQKKR